MKVKLKHWWQYINPKTRKARKVLETWVNIPEQEDKARRFALRMMLGKTFELDNKIKMNCINNEPKKEKV